MILFICDTIYKTSFYKNHIAYANFTVLNPPCWYVTFYKSPISLFVLKHLACSRKEYFLLV